MIGNSSDSTLTGYSYASPTVWTLDDDPTYATHQTLNLGFNSFTALNGTGGADQFTVSSTTATVANIGAGAGANSITVNSGSTLTGGYTGGADADTATITGTLSGTLALGDGSNTATISGSVGAGVTGGINDDAITLTGSVTGNVSLGAGADTLDYTGRSGAVSVTLASASGDGFTSTTGPAGISGTFSGVNTLTGNGVMGGQLTGFAATATWALATTQTVTYGANALTFSAFPNLVGNDDIDQFTVSVDTTANLSGGDGTGTNTYTVNGSVTLTGTITGGSTTDNVTINGTAGAINGGGGGDTINVNGTAGDIDGGAGGDTIVINGTSGAVTGGSNNDEITVGGFAVIGGTGVAGGAGTDTLNAVSISFITNTITSNSPAIDFTGFTDYGISNTVQGANTAITWTWDGSGWTYGSTVLGAPTTVSGGSAVDTFALNGNLGASRTANGNSGADIFNVGAGITILGTLAGGADVDVLNVNYTTDLSLGLTTPDSDGFGITGLGAGTITGIGTLNGGTGSDTLTGLDSAYFWVLGGTPTYQDAAMTPTFSLNFGSFEILTGGTAVDTFSVTANTTAILNGGAGNDVFTVAASTTLTGSINGDADDDNITIGGTVAGANVGYVTVNIDGGIGIDTLNAYTGVLTTLVVNGWSGTVTGTPDNSAFTGINIPLFATFTGTGGDDAFSYDGMNWFIGLTNIGNPTTINGGAGHDTFAINANVATTINGDGGNDSVTVATTVTYSGNFNGGDDNDTLTLVAGNGTGPVLTQFTGTFSGGIGNDELVLNGFSAINNTTSFSGGGGDNKVTFIAINTGPQVGVSASDGNGVTGSVAYNGSTGGLVGIDEVVVPTSPAGVLSYTGSIATKWTINASGSNTMEIVGGNTLTFSGIRKLNGGSGTDTFTFIDSVAIATALAGATYQVDGGDGSVDKIVIDDSAVSDDRDYIAEGDTDQFHVAVNNEIFLTATNFEELDILGGTGADSLDATGLDAGVTLTPSL